MSAMISPNLDSLVIKLPPEYSFKSLDSENLGYIESHVWGEMKYQNKV